MPTVDIVELVKLITLAIQQAPQIVEIAEKGKEFIATLLGAKIISVEQQNSIHAHIDAVCAAALAGEVPPSWQVEPDPVG